MKDSVKLSAKSAEIVERALKYAQGGCPLQASHVISDLVRRIKELENVNCSTN